MDLSRTYQMEKDDIRQRFNSFIKQAFYSLPHLSQPTILDIGCGTGVSTILLATETDGFVSGIDIDRDSLDILRQKIIRYGLEHRISIINDSITSYRFNKNSFDIIWAEGSLFIMGFEQSLIDWYQLIKPQGFLVVHDAMEDMDKKIEMIPSLGYLLINHFTITETQWWTDYFSPLKDLIKRYEHQSHTDERLSALLLKDMGEISLFESDPLAQSSFYAIMQKKNER